MTHLATGHRKKQAFWGRNGEDISFIRLYNNIYPAYTQAHNLKVLGSNPSPATNFKDQPAMVGLFFCWCEELNLGSQQTKCAEAGVRAPAPRGPRPQAAANPSPATNLRKRSTSNGRPFLLEQGVELVLCSEPANGSRFCEAKDPQAVASRDADRRCCGGE